MTSTDIDGLSVARDLHDSVLQDLIVVAMQLRRAGSTDDPVEKASAIDTALAAAHHGMAETRGTIQRLREVPGAAFDAGGPDVCVGHQVREVFAELEGFSDMHMSVVADHGVLINRATASEVVKIVREAAMNAIRHSRASHLTCRVRRHGNRALSLKVYDNGKGYPLATQSYGLGVLGMRERAQLIGATLKITSACQRGSGVSLVVPTGKTVRADTANEVLTKQAHSHAYPRVLQRTAAG
jgi:signal transduction histidine kinase